VSPRGGVGLAPAQGKGSQPQCHLALGSNPAQGQATQVSSVPTWGRWHSSCTGQGQTSPITTWYLGLTQRKSMLALAPVVLTWGRGFD